MAGLRTQLRGESKDQRRWRAAEIAARLQRRHPSPQLGRAPAVEDERRRRSIEAGLAATEALRSAYPLVRSAAEVAFAEGAADAYEAVLATGEGPAAEGPAAEATVLVAGSGAAEAAEASGRGRGSPLPLSAKQRRAMRALKPPLPSPAPETAPAEQAPAENRPAGMARHSLRSGKDGSYWRAKKRPQLTFMCTVIRELVSAHPEHGKRPLHIVDIGGGKGYLAEHLARELGSDVVVTLVDVVGKRLRQARARLDGLQGPRLSNLRFIEGDAAQLAADGVLPCDIATGLHACGALSDVIIGHAVQQGAAFAVTTCCFNSHPTLRVARPPDSSSASATTSEGDDELGLGVRRMERNEWLLGSTPLPEASLTELLKAAELSANPDLSRASAHSINALRARAAEASWDVTWGRGDRAHGTTPARLTAELLEFEARYSPRNFCVVGRPGW